MKKGMKFATALAGAAVVVVGGTAFTDGNDMITTRTFGYGETSVTGAVVTSEIVTQNAADNSKIDTIDFTTSSPGSTMATGYTFVLQANAGGTNYEYDCHWHSYNATGTVNTIHCPTLSSKTGAHQLTTAELVKIGLTVSSDANDNA